MTIYGMMRTSISGMNAQAARLTAIADNIANADTTGYKRSSIEFTDLVIPGGRGSARGASLYESGSVVPHTRQAVSAQGTFRYTTSPTDLALDGNGFFVVKSASGAQLLTRAGSFIPDGEGFLYNSANYYLQGYPIIDGQVQSVANGFAGLENVNIWSFDLAAVPTTSGNFVVNLPADTAISAASPPSANTVGAVYAQKSSLTVYDNLGSSRIVDVYMTKTAANAWEVTVYNQADAAAEGAPFPYASGPLATDTLTFSPTDGKLASSSATSLTFAVPGGSPVTLDMSGSTQLGIGYVVSEATLNGSAPSIVDRTIIDSDGVLYAGYTNGTFRALYKIPVATVISPDQLTPVSGTAYALSADSGDVTVGFVGEGSAGKIMAATLEQSNVDIAEELTVMIQAQRGYSANSKVFQTGSEITDIAINLKR
ncbi:MAG: flagellar hook protein FlgE [Rhizobiaceae bacterium]